MTFRPCRIEWVHCLFSSTFKLNIHFLDAECVSIKCSMFLIKIFLIPSPFKDQILKIPADEKESRYQKYSSNKPITCNHDSFILLAWNTILTNYLFTKRESVFQVIHLIRPTGPCIYWFMYCLLTEDQINLIASSKPPRLMSWSYTKWRSIFGVLYPYILENHQHSRSMELNTFLIKW